MEKIAPKVIIGLGNPGPAYTMTRHNIGFRIVDTLAEKYHGDWRVKDKAEIATILVNGQQVLLVKPQTFMNSSGLVIPFLTKQGIKPQDALIVHDELEMPFGKISIKFGGSARGHNGLKSFIATWGDQFARLRFGISRPERKEDVPHYVLQVFKETRDELESALFRAVELIETLY